MSNRALRPDILAVLREAGKPITSREIADRLPEHDADQVMDTVRDLGRIGAIRQRAVRNEPATYSLRQSGATGQIARTYKPPVQPAPVRVMTAADLAAAVPAAPPAPVPKAPTALEPSLQQHVRRVVESDPARRWTLEQVVAAVKDVTGNRTVRPDQVRSRLGNLTRSGHSSPLRRMPADGTWMVNTPANRAAAAEEAVRRESKAAQVAADHSAQRRARSAGAAEQAEVAAVTQRLLEAANASPAAAAAVPVVDTRAVAAAVRRARAAKDPDRIEHPERGALRALILAVVQHVDQPPEPVVRALSRGLDSLGSHAA